jgi:hypothetical protein
VKGTCQIVVRGKHKTWAFNFPADPKYLPEWEADGLEVYEVTNSIPEWAVNLGLTRPWVAVQDFWNWIRLW